jgi:hypothetical protein
MTSSRHCSCSRGKKTTEKKQQKKTTKCKVFTFSNFIDNPVLQIQEKTGILTVST